MKKTIPLPLRILIDSQSFGILGSIMDSAPYSNLMAFISDNDYHSLIFVTSRDTRKYHNLTKNPDCSMFIDNRENETPSSLEAKGVCACGQAFEIADGHKKNDVTENYIKRHPALSGFIKSPNVAIFEMKVSIYYLVENFQEVTEIHLDK